MLRHIRLVSGRIVELSGKNDALLIGGDETKRHILKFETLKWWTYPYSLVKERIDHAYDMLPGTNLQMAEIVISTNMKLSSEIINFDDHFRKSNEL